MERHGLDYPVIIEALILSEDHRASRHNGIDFFSLARSVIKPTNGRFLSGVSTIEQQLARTIFPRNGRNIYIRKFYETYLSYYMSKKRPKFAIWSAYLMSAYYGTGITGYTSARQVLYPSGRRLTNLQAAKIVSCLKYPRPRNPSAKWKARHKARAAYIMARWP